MPFNNRAEISFQVDTLNRNRHTIENLVWYNKGGSLNCFLWNIVLNKNNKEWRFNHKWNVIGKNHRLQLLWISLQFNDCQLYDIITSRYDENGAFKNKEYKAACLLK